jgi:hypothetical protein
MTPADKWNSVSPTVDTVVALMMFSSGLVLFLIRKKQTDARQARVESGELTKEQADKNGKMLKLGSIGMIALSIILFALTFVE